MLCPLLANLGITQNKVELRYCDGASVSGDKPTPTTVGNATLHFRGRAILDADVSPADVPADSTCAICIDSLKKKEESERNGRKKKEKSQRSQHEDQ